jgi:hypothetical protein
MPPQAQWHLHALAISLKATQGETLALFQPWIQLRDRSFFNLKEDILLIENQMNSWRSMGEWPKTLTKVFKRSLDQTEVNLESQAPFVVLIYSITVSYTLKSFSKGFRAKTVRGKWSWGQSLDGIFNCESSIKTTRTFQGKANVGLY